MGTSAAVRAVRLDPGAVRLRVTAQERPGPDLLTALAHESGIVGHLPPQPEGGVTAAVRDVPVEDAPKRLVGRDAQYCLRLQNVARRGSGRRGVGVAATDAPLLHADARCGIGVSRARTFGAGENLARRAEVRAVIEPQVWADIPALVDALSDDDLATRRGAAAELAHLPSGSVVEARVERRPRESDPRVRAAVAARDRR